jgi:hypothetical protein
MMLGFAWESEGISAKHVASGRDLKQTQPMFGLLQRRLVISELHRNEEAVAHSLRRGGSVLKTAHTPIHNL